MTLKDTELKPFFIRKQSPYFRLSAKDSQVRFQSGDIAVARPIVDAAIFMRRRVVLLPFAMILGICIYSMLPLEPPFWLYGILTIVLFSLSQMIRIWIGRNIAYVSAFVLMGISLMSATALMRGTEMLAFPTAGQIEGHITELEMRPDGARRVVLQLNDLRPRALDGVRFVRLTIAEKHLGDWALAMGDVVSVRARFIPVPKPSYPGAYDAQFHAYFGGIGAYGSTLDPVSVRPGDPTFWDGLQTSIFDLRARIGERFSAGMNVQDAAIARALIIGDQSALDPVLRDEIAVSGLAHLLAISGLHLSLVAGGAFFALRFVLALPFVPHNVPAKAIAAVAAMAAALFYLGISGANIATQRATIMLIVAFIAVLVGRRAITLRNVALVCLLIIFVYPNEVFKPGFQLSFSAVAALVGAYEWSKSFRRNDRIWPRWAKFLGGLSLTSLIAGLATAPIAAVHFSQFAPFGLFANLVAVPLVGFLVLPTLIAACLLMPLGLEVPFLWIAGWGIEQVVAIAIFFTELGGEWTYVPPVAGWVLPLCGVALMLFLIVPNVWRFVPPILATLMISIFGQAVMPDILISDQTRSAFVRQDRGEWAQIDRIGNNFTTRVWAEWLGVDLETQEIAGNCDDRGCIAEVRGIKVLFARDKAAVLEDCGLVDLIIEQDSLYQSCERSVSFVRHWHVRRWGAAAIYIDDSRSAVDALNIRIEHVIKDAKRPWRIRND